jgi:hypothetical protein
MPGQQLMVVALDEYKPAEDKKEDVVADLETANVITSIYADDPPSEAIASWLGAPNLHRPVLDIDFPATLLPSSTPGHHHLYLDVPMHWERYRKLLEALAEAGVVETGYVAASISRGYTAVRLPWVRKVA